MVVSLSDPLQEGLRLPVVNSDMRNGEWKIKQHS